MTRNTFSNNHRRAWEPPPWLNFLILVLTLLATVVAAWAAVVALR